MPIRETHTDDAESTTNDLDLADEVEDRDATDPNTAVVVALPDEPAYAFEIPVPGVGSVADVNPDYAAGGPVATVAFETELAAALDVWREADPETLAGLCEDEGVRTYTYPVERLRPVTMTDGGTARPDAITGTANTVEALVRGQRYAELLFDADRPPADDPPLLVGLNRVDSVFFERVETERPEVAADPLYHRFKRDLSAGEAVVCVEHPEEFPGEFGVEFVAYPEDGSYDDVARRRWDGGLR